MITLRSFVISGILYKKVQEHGEGMHNVMPMSLHGQEQPYQRWGNCAGPSASKAYSKHQMSSMRVEILPVWCKNSLLRYPLPRLTALIINYGQAGDFL